tara:strand:+ start:1427 stop:2131 length:705 start_codon:yes stop_codon:yes gene_type:complete
MKLYILSFDRLINETMKMVEFFFDRYWSTVDVTVLGYKVPDYKSDFVKFESLGKDVGVDVVCQQLYDFFSKIDDEYFMLGQPDQPLVTNVDTNLVDFLQNIVTLNDDVGRCSLTLCNSTRPHDVIDEVDEVKVIENIEGTEYKLSAVYSIWNKKYFLKYLEESKDLWDWEVNASAKSINDGWRIVGSVPSPIDYTHLFKRNELRSDWYYSTEPGSSNVLSDDEQNKLKEIFKIN